MKVDDIDNSDNLDINRRTDKAKESATREWKVPTSIIGQHLWCSWTTIVSLEKEYLEESSIEFHLYLLLLLNCLIIISWSIDLI